MIYEKDKIKNLIEYKDKIIDEKTKNELEWIIECYNNYFVESEEFEYQKKEYKKVLNKYYNSEDQKVSLKQELKFVKRKCKELEELARMKKI